MKRPLSRIIIIEKGCFPLREAPKMLRQSRREFRARLRPRLCDGRYVGLIISIRDLPVAGIGLMISDCLPHPLYSNSDKRGYVFNLFVEPGYWKRDFATHLMNTAEGAFSDRGVRYLDLHPTENGSSYMRSWTGKTQSRCIKHCRNISRQLEMTGIYDGNYRAADSSRFGRFRQKPRCGIRLLSHCDGSVV